MTRAFSDSDVEEGVWLAAIAGLAAGAAAAGARWATTCGFGDWDDCAEVDCGSAKTRRPSPNTLADRTRTESLFMWRLAPNKGAVKARPFVTLTT